MQNILGGQQEKTKSALILIETQNEWMHSDGKLNKALVKDKEMMQTSIANIEKTLEYARKNGIEVISVDLSEVLKGMGAVHCATVFLKRG